MSAMRTHRGNNFSNHFARPPVPAIVDVSSDDDDDDDEDDEDDEEEEEREEEREEAPRPDEANEAV